MKYLQIPLFLAKKSLILLIVKKIKESNAFNFLNITSNLIDYNSKNESSKSSLNICWNGYLFDDIVAKTDLSRDEVFLFLQRIQS